MFDLDRYNIFIFIKKLKLEIVFFTCFMSWKDQDLILLICKYNNSWDDQAEN
jgi:hypothetical protein